MQLDKPARRRPSNQNRSSNPNVHSQRDQPPSTRADPFSQPSDISQPSPPFHQSNPFQPRIVTPPKRPRRRSTTPFSTGPPDVAPDPFQPLPQKSGFGAPRKKATPDSFEPSSNAFGQGSSAFSREAAPFGQSASSFGQKPSSSRRKTSRRSGMQMEESPGRGSDPFSQDKLPFSQTGDPFVPEPASFGQNQGPFGQASRSFGQASGPFAQNPGSSDRGADSSVQNSESFADKAGLPEQHRGPLGHAVKPFEPNSMSFGDQPRSMKLKRISFARDLASFSQNSTPFTEKPAAFSRGDVDLQRNPVSFGSGTAMFGEAEDPFDQKVASMNDNRTSLAMSQQDLRNQIRTPKQRRPRKSVSDAYPDESKRGTAFRGMRQVQRELDPDYENDVRQNSSETDNQKQQPGKTSQLLLKAVPVPLFSRAALQRHFSLSPGVNVTHVNLRGTRRPDSRRTALITFPSEQQASLALRNVQAYKGTELQLVPFRQSNQAHEKTSGETNELFFNFVPESLFSEESITDLFENISENSVTKVSLREKPHYGTVKRTAIITFNSVSAATLALRNLPMYKGRTLTVSYRRGRPQPHHPAPPNLDDSGDVENAFVPEFVKSEAEDDADLGTDPSTDLPTQYEDLRYAIRSNAGSKSYTDPGYSEMENEEEAQTTARQKTKSKQDEITILKEAILRKEKERAQMTQSEKFKRGKKLAVPQSRRSSKAEQGASDSGWRQVGEKVDIRDATNFVGTCMTMCPLKEFEDRIIQRDISLFEKDDEGEPAFARAVKKYRRSAAISEQPSPGEVRPSDVLLDTMEHLKNICDTKDEKFADIHNFVRDRTRSLRQDFTVQGIRNEACIKIHEESVRFHILSEHRLFGEDAAVFSSKQNLEQLDKCLISLREMYDIRRDKDLDTSQNEPEMQAYYMLTQMSDPKTCVQLCTGFAPDVRSSEPVQFALEVIRAASGGFGSFTRYFSLVRSAPYLMACLMHSRFSTIRVQALAVINATHGNPLSKDNIPITAITRQLGFENNEEASEFCLTLGMAVEYVLIPSLGSEELTIQTPSDSFDEMKVVEWEPSRADILIESKADGIKTSEIIRGRVRSDFKARSLGKKIPKRADEKDRMSSITQSKLLSPQTMRKDKEIISNSQELTNFRKNSFAQQKTQTSAIGFPTLPSKSITVDKSTFFNPEDQRIGSSEFPKPVKAPTAGSFTGRLGEQKTFKSPTEPFLGAGAEGFRAVPSFGSVVPQDKPAAPVQPILSTKAKPRKAGGRVVRFSLDPNPTETWQNVPRTSPLQPFPSEPKVEPVERLDRNLTNISKQKEGPAPQELETTNRRATLKALLTDLIDANEADFTTARKIIKTAHSGIFKFPKAMEVWDDAKDVLLAVSERSERGSRELRSENHFDITASKEGDRDIKKLNEKLQNCSSEGAELWDQLNEVFSKCLVNATAKLKGSKPSTTESIPITATRSTGGVDTFLEYGSEDEDAVQEVPDSGVEVQSVLGTMREFGLPRWQAVISDVMRSRVDGNEFGIAKRWLRQRLSTGTNEEAHALCQIHPREGESSSVSIQEVKEVSEIPFTADLIVIPCDARTMRRDEEPAWSLLRKVLRENRSMSLAHRIPPPSIVVLYYRGSSDLPAWFIEEDVNRGLFPRLQQELIEQGYVASCEKLELPRTIAFEGLENEQLTGLMKKSVGVAAEGLVKMDSMPTMVHLRDHLVYVANRELSEVLGSRHIEEDATVAIRIIHRVNDAWKEVARCLRREEARWPKEMARHAQLVDAYLTIETKLQLPQPKTNSSIVDYVRDLAFASGVGVLKTGFSGDIFSFCTALGHLMNAFICRKLMHCPVTIVYVTLNPCQNISLKKTKSIATFLVNPVELDTRTTQDITNEMAWIETPRKAKRLREEKSSTDDYRLAKYPQRRRLSAGTADSLTLETLPSAEFAANRRQSLPASYGRRRMFELLDSICGEEQAFDEMIQTTMHALRAKRRRLELENPLTAGNLTV